MDEATSFAAKLIEKGYPVQMKTHFDNEFDPVADQIQKALQTWATSSQMDLSKEEADNVISLREKIESATSALDEAMKSLEPKIKEVKLISK